MIKMIMNDNMDEPDKDSGQLIQGETMMLMYAGKVTKLEYLNKDTIKVQVEFADGSYGIFKVLNTDAPEGFKLGQPVAVELKADV